MDNPRSTRIFALSVPQSFLQLAFHRPADTELVSGCDMVRLWEISPDVLRLFGRHVWRPLFEDGQIFHRQREDEKAHGDDAYGDHHPPPLRTHVMPAPQF